MVQEADEELSVNGLALCAGIGSLDLGVRAALGERHRVVCYVEREARAAATLVARMDDAALDRAPVWDDLATFGGGAWRGVVDLVTAGLPCQPYSLAGLRRGNGDDRALWPLFVRIVAETQPGAIFLENVPGFLKHFEAVYNVLRDLGFVFAPPIRASALGAGAPHRRRRLFVLAANPERDGWERIVKAWTETQAASRAGITPPDALGLYIRKQPWRRSWQGWAGEAEPGAHSAQAEAHATPDSYSGGLPVLGGGWTYDEERQTLRHDTERCSPGQRCGVGTAWQAESPILRVADGLAGRVDELRLIGNAVVPQAAKVAFDAGMTALLDRTGEQ